MLTERQALHLHSVDTPNKWHSLMKVYTVVNLDFSLHFKMKNNYVFPSSSKTPTRVLNMMKTHIRTHQECMQIKEFNTPFALLYNNELIC